VKARQLGLELLSFCCQPLSLARQFDTGLLLSCTLGFEFGALARSLSGSFRNVCFPMLLFIVKARQLGLELLSFCCQPLSLARQFDTGLLLSCTLGFEFGVPDGKLRGCFCKLCFPLLPLLLDIEAKCFRFCAGVDFDGGVEWCSVRAAVRRNFLHFDFKRADSQAIADR
jgi:hypothetical protein